MTMDNGMDVSPSWEELREERDALAAKLEEIELVAMAEGAKPKMRAAIDEGPETSLARREAAIRRDEVESVLSVIGAYPDRAAVFDMLRERSEELRRQAEERVAERQPSEPTND